MVKDVVFSTAIAISWPTCLHRTVLKFVEITWHFHSEARFLGYKHVTKKDF